jgi:hypothetical protein
MMNVNWPLIRARLKEAVLVLPHFFKNPVQGMRHLPDWQWPEMLILQAAFAAICAVLTNAVGRHWLLMLTGLIIGPLTQLLVVSISAGFFYYIFLFFFKREIPYRAIYLHLIFAAVPALILNILSPMLPPVLLIGASASLLLLFVGFVDNFHLDPARLRKLLGGLLAIYATMWIIQMIGSTSRHHRLRERATPESLDILEKELNPDGK